MVAYIFDSLIHKAESAGVKRDSRAWFRKQAQAVNANPALMLRSQANRLTNIPMIVACTCSAMIQKLKTNYHITIDIRL
jgi:hypothetical protein